MKKIFSMNRFEGWNLSPAADPGRHGSWCEFKRPGWRGCIGGRQGVISTAQIGFEEPDFVGNEEAWQSAQYPKAYRACKRTGIWKRNDSSQRHGGITAIQGHVKEAVRAGADAVICGAGLPVDLPELVEAGKAKIAPIVSSRRAAALLLKTWGKKYGRTADFYRRRGAGGGRTSWIFEGAVR